MIGNLGKVNPNYIQGWAYSEENDTPIRLKILVDNQVIDEITSNIERPDVLNSQINAQLNCGFKFKIPEKVQLASCDVLRVVFSSTNLDLNGSPYELAELIDPSTKTNVNYFFLHIPKTAGTSFRIELLNYFGEESLYPNNNDLNSNHGRYLKASELINLSNGRKKSIQVLSGHYGLQVKKEIAPNSKLLTFLRNPIERAVSNLKHLQRNTIIFKDKPLLEIAKNDNKVNPEIFNRQCAMLWNGENPNDKLNTNHALKNLSQFDFFGITEYYKPSIELCNKTLGWKLQGAIFANKAKNSGQQEETNPELLAFIREHNIADMELYENAVELFKKRCSQNRIRL